jgi:integrase
LAPPALELIARLRRDRGTSEFVFPGGIDGEPLRALWHVWHHVRDHAKLEPDARLYDVRHTFASLGAGSGLSLPLIGRLLGHTQARTTQRYAKHLADDPLREAATKITAAITSAGQPGAKVLPLKG